MVDGARKGVLLREAEELWLKAPTLEGVTEVLFGCADGSDATVTEVEVLLVSRVP